MEENNQLEQSVIEVEKEIKDAEKIKSDRLAFLDKIRKLWVEYVFQNNWGNRIFKVLMALIVFVSLFLTVNKGLDLSGSLLNRYLPLLSGFSNNVKSILLIIEIAISFLWLSAPSLGTFITAVVI